MKKLEYFNTPEGQIHLRLLRLKSWFYVDINQEPKSKSINEEEAVYFQNKILEALKKQRKRAYSSSIVLQIDFYTSQKTPPGIHSLAKNYLDLLKKPLPGLRTKYKSLLYKDDCQIKLLIVNYHLGEGPAIHVEADTLRNFICDLDLFRRIEGNDFEESEKFDEHDLASFSHKLEDKLHGNDMDDVHSTPRDLRDLEASKDVYIKKNGLKFYLSYRDMVIRDIQCDYLKSRQLTVNWLLSIFPSYYLKERSRITGIELFGRIPNVGRNFVSTLGIHLPTKPTEEGKSKEFKKEIKIILQDFKKRYPVLFPLKSVLGITVLFLPPKNENTDLDNLARKYIVPFINEVVQPPRHYAETVNISDVSDGFIKKDLLEDLNRLPKDPRHSIVQYQIIEVPRLENDSPEGYIRLFFNDGGYESNLWVKVKHILDEWEDSID